MARFIYAFVLAGALGIAGCPASNPPGSTDLPKDLDTNTSDSLGNDGAGVDTIPGEDLLGDSPAPTDNQVLDIHVEDSPATPDTIPGDIPTVDVPGPCAGLECLPTCVSDSDCDMGHVCVPHHDGCCTECVPFCEICYMTEGSYCPETPPDDLCELGLITATEVGPCWFEVEYTGEDGTDLLFMDGCMDHTENLPNNQCGLAFDDMTDSFEVACNWCGPVKYTKAACGEAMVELTPVCVHAPHLVAAGGPLPVAVYGQTGCADYHHAEVVQDGFDIQITLWGLSDADPCDEVDACGAQDWSYAGLVFAEAPNPGAYTVTVAGAVTQIVGASGGIIAEPACQDDCASPELATFDWTLEAMTDGAVTGDCMPPPGDPGSPVTFDGACQDFTVSGQDWDLPSHALHCNDSEVYFGNGAPYIVDARTCDPDPLGWTGEILLLGVAQAWTDPSVGTRLFLLRGLKQP